ncbi:hypothetical protein ARMSODRAFT_946504 [Armillaria solidipes]|uniref:Arrestin-like N-terminal domain-containing protein n=1 Tax=Armillaria solidipes TaxID=1076256 RepID=A0A2H3CLK3_9AGAR|nr:hypothetical protein ARMSODRAFT_946504 [Armillaria solidipes]
MTSSDPIPIPLPSMDADLTLNTEYLPEYDTDLSLASPSYSAHPGLTEISLHPEPFSPEISSSTHHWSCETKHMRIDLGPHIWGLTSPSYGLGGTVVGSVKFLEQRQHVEQVTVSFEGRLTTFRPYRGTNSDSASPIVSRTFPLYTSCMGCVFDWEAEHPFTIPIPTEINTPGGGTAPTPPSFNCYFYGSAVEVTYTIKIDMVHKGNLNNLRRHETKAIPVYYLPKTQPADPPLSTIPRPSRLSEETDIYLHWLDRVHTAPATPSWTNTKCKSEMDRFMKAVYVSIPTPQRFSAGDEIPFAVSLLFTKEPYFAKLLTRCIRVVLLKRISFGPKKKTFNSNSEENDNSNHSEWVLTSGQLKYQNEFAEGVRLLRGYVKAGATGKESSWLVDSVGVQYVIRVTVVPPKNLADHIPLFHHEEIVELTTDHWGPSPQPVVNGMPTPAIGLASDPQSNWIGNTVYAVV